MKFGHRFGRTTATPDNMTPGNKFVDERATESASDSRKKYNASIFRHASKLVGGRIRSTLLIRFPSPGPKSPGVERLFLAGVTERQLGRQRSSQRCVGGWFH
jgi:hypothetical protein